LRPRSASSATSPQGEIPLPDPLHEKGLMLANNGLGLVAAHLAWRYAARRLKPPDPIDHRTRRYAKLSRRAMPRQPILQNRRNSSFTKIVG
jgi:hypothetical protein